MAINQFVGIPDWRTSLTFTQSSVPQPGLSRVYPGPDGYWYVFNESNVVKRLAFDVQYGNGFESIIASTESFVESRIDINIGSGLTFSYDGIGSELYVAGLTSGSFQFVNSFTQGYVLSIATTSGAFEWVNSGFTGTTGSIPKFNTNLTLGDSSIRDNNGQVTIGSDPIFVSSILNIGTSSATGSGRLYVQDRIFLGDNQYRYIGVSNSNDVELNLSRNFILNSYTGVTGPSGPYFTMIEARTNQTTYDKNLNFLSGLVSVNIESSSSNGQWSLQKPQLFVQSTDLSPTFSFTSSNLFLGYISGPTGGDSTFKTVLGLSGGGIRIQDGSEGVHKVLVSSTTAGHGIWATMVSLGTRSRLPIYQRTDDFNLDDVLSFTESYPALTVSTTLVSAYPTFSRNFNVNVFVEQPSLSVTQFESAVPSNITQYGTGTFSVSYQIPNVSATQSDFVMNKGSQTIYGSKTFLDENELFGGRGSSTGLLIKDLSNTGDGPGIGTTYASSVGMRNNAIWYYLNSDRGTSSLNKQVLMAWQFTNGTLDKPQGYTTSYGPCFSAANISMGYSLLQRLSYPGFDFFNRDVVVDNVVWRTPTELMTDGNVTSNNSLPSKVHNPASSVGYTQQSRSFDFQVVRKKNSIFYYTIPRDTVDSLVYNFEFSRMGYTGSLTSNVVRMQSHLGHYLRMESGEFSGFITQSTGLFVNPQLGSFKNSGVSLTASRQVGIHVAQEVGYLRYAPAGYVREAYDYISGRITNGGTISGIGAHVGFFAQSKIVGSQSDPFGRRFYDYGLSAPYLQEDDVPIPSSPSSRLTPLTWSNYSTYEIKPWSFYAERDKSNFGGGLMVNVGATFGTTLGGYVDIQGLTGVYNSSLSTQVLQDLDGSYITLGAQSWSTILPQIYLRPNPLGLTPSGLTNGFMWYSAGALKFYDNNQTYNLLTPTTTGGGGGGLTGFGNVGNVPVWTATSILKGTSSIFISDSGDGNVGIKLRNFITPQYSLQVHTYSGSPQIALGLSGSILYQDGTNGITSSIMMSDGDGKTFLYPLVLPSPGLTTSYSRVGPTVGSGYLPLYVGLGNISGASGSSEYQVGPIYTDEFGNRISLLVRGQNLFSQNFSTTSTRNLTLTVPQLTGFVPVTSSGVVEFLMDYGNQTVYGQKSFDNRTRFQLEGLTAGEGNIGLLNLLGSNTNQNQRIVAQGRPFRRSDGTPNYGKSVLTLLTGTFSHFYSRVNLNDALSTDDGAVFWSAPFSGFTKNFQTVLDQVIGRYTESVLANNFTSTQGGKENVPNFIGNFDYSKISSTESNQNNPQTFIGNYRRTEFGHNLATQSSNWVITSPTASSNLFATSSVNLMTGLFVNNQVGGLSWSYASATYSIGVYTRQDVDNGLVSNAFDFFSSRIASTNSQSRILNHVGFYAQSKVFGTMLDPTGRQRYNPSQPWNMTFSYGWTSNSTMPWSFWSDTDKANLGGGLLVDIGATFGSSLSGWLDIQGLTGVYNTFSFTRTMTNINGELVSVGASSFGPILPQIRLKPSLSSLTPSLVDGSMWYKTGQLSFVDQGNVYNLLQVPSLLDFSPSTFYSNGITSIGGGLRLGAAGTAGPGLVHTGNQTFSGDKTFVNNIFFGPTSGNGNGLFFYDGGTQSKYTGFVGPTGISSNFVYILPSSTPTPNFFLRVVEVTASGSYVLGWATTSGPQGPAGPIGLGPGTVSLQGINLNGYPTGASLSISNAIQTFTFGAATEQFYGIVSTVSQNFGGTKSFRDSVFIGATATSTLQSTKGLFLHDTATFSEFFTGFVGPTQALGSNLVYIMPGSTPSSITGNERRFLTIRNNSQGISTQTYSLDWFDLPFSENVVIPIVSSFSGQTFTVSTADNGKMFDISTIGNVVYLTAPTFSADYFTASPRDTGFEFRVRKNDSGVGVVGINIPEVGGTPGNPLASPFAHLRRQNQTMEFKWNSSSQSWISYTIDNGYIQPNTILGNFNSEAGYYEDYDVVDYNDSTQNALNYSQGSFVNDWLSGVIYSSIDPIAYATTFSSVSSSLLNTQTNQYVGINTPGNPGSGLSIPAFALTRGKHLRLKMSGTYSKVGSSQAEFQFYLANQKLSGFTYSIGGIRATASFDIDFNLKVRYGGLSGSVHGFGSISIDQLSSGATTYLLNNYNIGYQDVNLSSTSIFDVRIANQSGQLGVTINSATLERLA
jgi:hypothetical protein